MATATVQPFTIPDSFSVQQLYELQARRGKIKPPAISYAQRNSLKMKCRARESFGTGIVRAIICVFKSGGDALSFLVAPHLFLSWLKYVVSGQSCRDDLESGRDRMSRMRFGAAARGVGARSMADTFQDRL